MTERNDDDDETGDVAERHVEPPAPQAPMPVAVAEVDPWVAMDQESPASIRGTFIVLTLVAGLLLLPPRQFVSSRILIVISVSLAVYHFVSGRRAPPPAPVTAPEEAAE